MKSSLVKSACDNMSNSMSVHLTRRRGVPTLVRRIIGASSWSGLHGCDEEDVVGDVVNPSGVSVPSTNHWIVHVVAEVRNGDDGVSGGDLEWVRGDVNGTNAGRGTDVYSW